MTFYAVYYIVYVVEQMLGRKRETNIFQMPKQEKSIEKQSRKIQRFYESWPQKGPFPMISKLDRGPKVHCFFQEKIITLLPNNFVGSSLSNHLHMI